MFEGHKAKRAAEEQAAAVKAWSHEAAALQAQLDEARSFAGTTTNALIVLKRGEVCFASVRECALVEARRGAGQWEGRSRGVSIPVLRTPLGPVRYRVGSSRGHYEAGPEVLQPVDSGTMSITNARVVFAGQKTTRECLFSKLVSYEHYSDATSFSVSNRQKPTTIRYGVALGPEIHFRFELALAHFRDDVATLITQLESELTALQNRRPAGLL